MIKINSCLSIWNDCLVKNSILRHIDLCKKCNSNSTLHYKYTPKVEAGVNEQIQIEQQAAQDYLNISVKLLHPCQLWLGASGFFMKMYEEELKHMQLFILYQLRRGGTPVISSLKQPPVITQLSLVDAFKKALDMEKGVTMSLEGLITVAEKEQDYQCVDFVTSKFLSEQMSSIDELSQHIVNLCKLSQSEHALYHYDLELAKRYPYSFLPI